VTEFNLRHNSQTPPQSETKNQSGGKTFTHIADAA
jgi:hypothetical protein